MLLKCTTSPLRRVPAASQSGSAVATTPVTIPGGGGGGSLAAIGATTSTTLLSPPAGKGKGKGGGKNGRNGFGAAAAGCGGTIVSGGGAGPVAAGTVKHGVSPSSSLASKLHRKVLRVPAKRIPGKVLHHPGKLASVASKLTAAKQRLQQHQQQQLQQFNLQPLQQRPPPPTSGSSSSSSSTNVNNCDNSNDSGLGFDRSLDSAALGAQFHNGTNPHSHTSTVGANSAGLGGNRPIQQPSAPTEDEGVDSESGWSTTSSGNGHAGTRRFRGGKPASMFGASSRRTTSRSSVASSRSSSTASTKSLKRTHLELEDSTACSGALFALTATNNRLPTPKLKTIATLAKPLARTVAAPKKIIIPVVRTPAGKSATITIAAAATNSTSLSLQPSSPSPPQPTSTSKTPASSSAASAK